MHHGRIGIRIGTASLQCDGEDASHQLVLLCGELHVSAGMVQHRNDVSMVRSFVLDCLSGPVCHF
jgi:hypothetical protein